jgi:hypothetical protein
MSPSTDTEVKKTLDELRVEQRKRASDIISNLISTIRSLDKTEETQDLEDSLLVIGGKIQNAKLDDNSLELRLGILTKFLSITTNAALTSSEAATQVTSSEIGLLAAKQDYDNLLKAHNLLINLRTGFAELSNVMAWLNHFDYNIKPENQQPNPDIEAGLPAPAENKTHELK